MSNTSVPGHVARPNVAVSVFGKTLTIHEWVHDSRHFRGFPCCH